MKLIIKLLKKIKEDIMRELAQGNNNYTMHDIGIISNTIKRLIKNPTEQDIGYAIKLLKEYYNKKLDILNNKINDIKKELASYNANYSDLKSVLDTKKGISKAIKLIPKIKKIEEINEIILIIKITDKKIKEFNKIINKYKKEKEAINNIINNLKIKKSTFPIKLPNMMGNFLDESLKTAIKLDAVAELSKMMPEVIA